MFCSYFSSSCGFRLGSVFNYRPKWHFNLGRCSRCYRIGFLGVRARTGISFGTNALYASRSRSLSPVLGCFRRGYLSRGLGCGCYMFLSETSSPVMRVYFLPGHSEYSWRCGYCSHAAHASNRTYHGISSYSCSHCRLKWLIYHG